MRKTRGVIPSAIAVAIACAPIHRPPSPDAPVNTCPEFPCTTYSQEEQTVDSGAVVATAAVPVCVSNACLVNVPPTIPQHLIVVVASTYALPFPKEPEAGAPGAGPSTVQPIVQVPSQTSVTGVYWAQRSDAYNPQLPPFGQIGFYLAGPTAIPSHVTFRPVWSPAGSDAAAPLPEAVELGLPLEPIQAGHQLVSPSYTLASGIPVVGPGGAPVLLFVASLQPGLTYERTITPDPPFDVAFPPDIRLAPQSLVQQQELTLDTTGGLYPHFFLTSARGVEGWTVYLRDTITKRRVSPARLLSNSTVDGGVLLPTSRQPPTVDALTGLELVIVPAADSGLPTYVPVPPPAVPQKYPLVPNPVRFFGQIDWSDAQAPPSQVTFEATGIYAAPQLPMAQSDAGAMGDATTAGAVDAGTPYQLLPGFEFTSTTTAEPDAGTSTYEIQIPCGAYRVVVRPQEADPSALLADASPGAKHAVTVAYYDTGANCGAPPPGLAIGFTSSVRGRATVADGRPLSAATVEALPAHCAALAADAGVASNDSPSCMPRYATTTTDPAGAFELELDPGGYVLRVEPLDGTRLPWVIHSITVPTSDPVGFTIPAPVYRGLQLLDTSSQIPVANAVVRMFSLQGKGPAIEVGRAITDENGRFDMYIDPAVQ